MPPPHPSSSSQPHQHPDIWKQMSYTPPRGSCAHKPTMLSPTCACLRFMIHPLKATSSFDCDGCGHHASFHRMENRADEEVVERWREREREEGTGVDAGVERVERQGDWGRARKVRRVVGVGGGRGGASGAGVGRKRKLLTTGERDGDGRGAETDTVGEDDGDGDGVQVVGAVSRSRRIWGG